MGTQKQEYNIKPYGSDLWQEDEGKKVSEKDIKGYFSYEDYRAESGTDPESGEWGDAENAEDTKKSRERAIHERKVKRRLGDKRNELKQAIEDHKNGYFLVLRFPSVPLMGHLFTAESGQPVGRQDRVNKSFNK